MATSKERDVVEVEVERLPERDDPRRDDPRRDYPGGSGARAAPDRKPLPPLAAGVVIDLLDFATRGVMGLYLGLPLGGGVGYYLGRRMGLDRRRSLGLAALCGLYCALPGTSPVPLGTLIAAYRVFSR